MGKIVTKTVEQDIYVSQDGRETPLAEMNDLHLVNAFGQACGNLPAEDYHRGAKSEERKLVDKLRKEILRRMEITSPTL